MSPRKLRDWLSIIHSFEKHCVPEMCLAPFKEVETGSYSGKVALL